MFCTMQAKPTKLLRNQTAVPDYSKTVSNVCWHLPQIPLGPFLNILILLFQCFPVFYRNFFQPGFTGLKLSIETLEQEVKNIKS